MNKREKILENSLIRQAEGWKNVLSTGIIPDDHISIAVTLWDDAIKALAYVETPEKIEKLAALLWKEQVTDAGAPNSVINGRTPEAFFSEHPKTRDTFIKYATCAIVALNKEIV